MGDYATPVLEDPFEVPVDDTVAMLLEAERAMAAVDGVTISRADYSAFREWKTYLASDGSATEQVVTHVGASLEANATNVDEVQRRSYPEAGGHRAAGYEHIRGLDLVARAPRLAEEAVDCWPRPCCRPVAAPSCSTPRSCTSRSTRAAGHPSELDRVFGTEAAYAGTSFLTTDKLEQGFRYGSPLIDITADATTPGGLGTFGWDDEGVAAQRVPLVRGGLFAATSPAARLPLASAAPVEAPSAPTAGTDCRSSA